MHEFSEVPVEVVNQHLKHMRTGVGLPEFPGEYRCYRAMLSDDDLPNLAMWFENEKHTRGGSCLLPDLDEERRHAPRVASFINGNPEKQLPPADLRTISGYEAVLLGFSTEIDFFYAIDGNNRLQAHYLTHRSIDGVPTFLCIHSAVQGWAYIPRFHKSRLAAEVA